MKIKILCLILLILPILSKEQTTQLNFTSIPTTNNDFIQSAGRSIEQWNNAIWNNIFAPQVPNGNTLPSNFYYRFNWIDIENQTQGVYDWSIFDQKVNTAIIQGSTFAFGIMPMCTACGLGSLTYPSYLHNLMQSESTNSQDWQYGGLGGDWIPNWNSPNYLSRWEALLNAVANHINTTSFNGVQYKNVIEYIDIRGYGDFGEWHTYPWNGTEPAGRVATITTLKRIIDAHKTAFPNYPLMVPMGAFDTGHDSDIPAEVGHYVLTTKNIWGKIGWRRDNLGDPGYSDWIEFNPASFNNERFDTLAMNRYKYAPIGGEPYYVLDAISANGTKTVHYDLLNEVEKFGLSFFGNGNYPVSNVSTANGLVTNVTNASKRTGYRIEPIAGSMTTTLIPNSTFNITLNWKNSGVAPAYDDWIVNYELRNNSNTVVATYISSLKLKELLPTPSFVLNENFTLGNIPTGTYNLYIKIIDAKGYRKPMFLAINGRTADGGYLLRSNISIQNTTPPPSTFIVNAGIDRNLSVGTTSFVTAPTVATSDTAELIVIWGESNAGGIAPNTSATSSELAPRSNIKILNNNTLLFETLDVGLNNNLKQYLPGFETTAHGMELGLANQTDSIMFKNPVYLVKLGASGSYIQQWLPNDVRDLWGEYTPLLDAAINNLNLSGIKYRITVWSSIGLNDKFSQGTTPSLYRSRFETFISSFRNRYGSNIPFMLMDFYNTPSQTSWDWRSTLDAMVVADNKLKVVSAQGSDYIDGSTHFAYNGFKILSQRMTDSTLSFWKTSYLWSKVSGPSGDVITRPTRPLTSITGLVSGIYKYRLAVSYNGITKADTVQITVGGALPIVFNSFDVLNKNNYNKLIWITNCDLNNDRFEIEKSSDGLVFKTIMTIKGTDSSCLSNKYSYNDNTKPLNKIYYRIKQIDKNGKFIYSKVIYVNVTNKNVLINLTPNPANSFLNLNLNGELNGNVILSFYSVEGKLVKQIVFNKENNVVNKVLDISDLNLGIYLCSVFINGEKQEIIKIFKNY